MSKGAILLVANYSNTTGYAWNNILRLFNAIAQHFSDLGYEIHICFAEIIPPITNFSPSLNLSFHEHNINNRSFSNTLDFIKLIKKHKINYIYLTDQNIIDYRYVFIRLLTEVKRIVIHNRVSVPDFKPAKYEAGIKGVIKDFLGNWDIVCADRTYAVSEFVRQRLLQKNRLPPRRVIKILNGIDIERFRHSTEHKTAHSTDIINIFSGSRATRYKGIHILIKSAALLKERIDTDFIIRYAGDGPDIEYFRNLVNSFNLNNQFLFLGKLPSVQEQLMKADIVVVPSIWGDACPSAALEALASGIPLVATSVGGVPEIVGDPCNAKLIPPGDEEALASALAELISSPELRKETGLRGRQRAERALGEATYHNTVINQLRSDFNI